MQAAYAVMAGVSDSWTTATVSLTGQPAILRTLTAAPQVSLLFLRLPDGQMTGSGTTAYANQSIAKLASGAIPAISSVDGASSYTHESLVAALASQLTALSPSVVRAQDTTYPDGDNSDHIEAGHLARAADAGYPAPHTLVTYRGYGVGGLAANVGSADLTAKLAAYNTYVSTSGGGQDPWTLGLVQREYPTDAVTTEDLARAAGVGVTASSQSTGSPALAVIDGYPTGAPIDAAREWVSAVRAPAPGSSSTSRRR